MSVPELQRDGRAMEVTAIYELPVPIWVMSDALGLTYPTGMGPVSFDVTMPSDVEPVGAAPDGLVPSSSSDEAGELLKWVDDSGAFIPEHLRPAKALLRVVVTNVQAPHDDDRAWRTPAQQLAEVISSWFDAVRSWAEVYTGQDLDPDLSLIHI